MIKNKTAAIISAAVLFFIVSGCATAGEKKIHTNVFQDTAGALVVFAGLGAGAYAGVQFAGGNNEDLLLGVTGGLLGAAAAGGIYWLMMNLVAEKIDTDANTITVQFEDKELLPRE